MIAFVFSIIAYAFSVVGRPFSEPFFETNVLLVSLIYAGRTVQAASRRSTGSAIRKLQDLQSSDVLLVQGKEHTEKLDSRLLHYGDIIRVLPDSRVPTDGMVVKGTTDVDESSVTGESLPVPKALNARVIAGTLNLGGTVDVQVTQLVCENSLARVTGLVRQAQASKAPMQDLADRFSAVVLPCAAVSAAVAFLAWVLVDRFVRRWAASESVVDGLTYGIAVLIVRYMGLFF